MAHNPLRVREAPRISANDLALFMVSSDTARMSIIRRAKRPSSPPIIRYKDIRQPICNYLMDDLRRIAALVSAEEMLLQRIEDPAETALRKDDARHSIQVLHAIQGMANQLAPYQFVAAPQNQPKLMLAGVEISIRADLLVNGSSRGKSQCGVALLRMTQDDSETEAARAKRRDMGLYVATLARLHADSLGGDREPTHRLCLSIDIQHGEAFAAPTSNARRGSDLESACRFIGAMWPSA